MAIDSESNDEGPDMARVDLPKDFEDEMKRLIEFMLDKVLAQVNKSVEEMVTTYPHLNNSTSRFNMGQTLMLSIMSEFKHAIDEELVMFISKATQGFVETAQSSQEKKGAVRPSYLG